MIQEEISKKNILKNVFLHPIRAIHLIRIIKNARDNLSPKENVFSFYSKSKKIRARAKNIRYGNPKLDVIIIGKENVKKIPSPKIYISWHHTIYKHLAYLREIEPELMGFRANDRINFGEWFISIGDNPKISMLKMSKHLKKNIPIAIAFDGGKGKRDLKGKIFGTEFNFSRGLIHLMRIYNPNIIPITGYLDDNIKNKIIIYVGKPLFTKQEISSLTDEEILKKILDYFTKDLKKHGPHHFNFGWVMKRKYN
jgi:hypothetical protein